MRCSLDTVRNIADTDDTNEKKLTEGAEETPLPVLLFAMVHHLSTVYHTNPIDLSEKPYEAVIGLYADLRTMQIAEKKHKKGGKQVIRRRAADDAGWW